jgi:hypothetical protein
MGSPGRASQQPLGRRLSGLSAACGRAGTSSWPPCTRRRCGQAAPGSMASPPRAAGNSVLGLGAGPGGSRSSSGRGRCPLPKEPGAETPGRPPRPDVQAAVVTGAGSAARPGALPARTSPAHPGHRMRELPRAGNERRVRLPPHRRAGRSRHTVPRLSRRCTVAARSCCHHDGALIQGSPRCRDSCHSGGATA